MKNLKNLLFILLSLFAISIYSQTTKNLNELSLKELKKEVNKGNPEAELLLGDKYLVNGEKERKTGTYKNKDFEDYAVYSDALKYYLRAAVHKNPRALYMVGKLKKQQIYYAVNGYFPSYVDRIYCGYYNDYSCYSWFIWAADQNYLEAQFDAGYGYQYGYGCTKDIEKAFGCYQKAAEQNIPEAQYELAMLYGYGSNGIKQDIEKYNLWLFKSANNNNYKAQNELALVYLKLEKFNEALIWAQKGYDNTPTIVGGSSVNRDSYIIDRVKNAIYEDSRDIEAAKQGEEGIAKLKEKRKKESDDSAARYKREEKQREEERQEAYAQARKEKAEREVEAEKRYQEKKWAQADQQKSYDNITKSLNEGQRQINAATNPDSYDARMLTAESKVKYEAMENRSSNSNSSSGSPSAKSSSSSNSSSENTSDDPSSSSNSSNEYKPKTKRWTQTEKHASMGYFYSESEGCEDIKRVVAQHTKMYNAKLISISICKCKDVTNEMGPDGFNPRKKKFACEAEAVFESINKY